MEAKATEVKKVQKHKNSYGKEVIVTEGRISLIETKESPIRGKLCKTYFKDGSSGYHIADNLDCNITEYSTVEKSFLVNPVIISEDEEVETGDGFLHENSICTFAELERSSRYLGCYTPENGWVYEEKIKNKIISLPQNFSPKHLQAIVDGKIKDGDTVLLECQELIPLTIKGDGLIKEVTEEPKGYFIKLNDKNQITIHPAVKEKNNKINLSKEELLDFCERYHRIRKMRPVKESDAWFEKNVSKFLFTLLTIILFFSAGTLWADGKQNTIDSLIKRSETAPNALEKAKIYNYLRHYYIENGNYPMALDNSLKALDIYEKKKDKENIFVLEGNTAYLYFLMQDNEASLRYLNKASVYRINDDYILFLKSAVCGKMGKYDLGIYYAKKCIQYSKDSSRIASAMNSCGTNFEHIGKLDSALTWYFKALKISESYDSTGLSESYGSIGDTYYKLKKYDRALFFENKSLALSNKYGLLTDARDTQKKLSEIYQATGNCKKSFEFYKKYTLLKDSLISEKEIRESSRIEESFKFEKQREIQKLEQQKKDIIKQAEIQHQRNIKNGFVIGLCIAIALSIFIFRIYRRTLKQKEEINLQKELIENEKQQTIQNIIYSKRIQDALMPPLSKIKELLPNSFIYNSPRDIISGDFYFVEKIDENKILFIVADCTSHSVSGCLMTILMTNLLHEAINKGNRHSADILNYVNTATARSFHQENTEKEIKDAMDCSVCILNTDTLELEFSGAYNDAIIIRNNEIIELEAQKLQIGNTNQLYKNIYFQLQKCDRIFLGSDGYADQFGIINGKEKKFKYKNFLNVLKSCFDKTMEESKIFIKESFENHKGLISQTDDVLVMGVEIN